MSETNLPKLNLKSIDVIVGMLIKPRKTIENVTFSVDHSKWIILMFVALALERTSNVVYRVTTESPYDISIVWFEVIIYFFTFAIFTNVIRHIFAYFSYLFFRLFKIDIDLEEVQIFLPVTYIPGILISICLMIAFIIVPGGESEIRTYLLFGPFLIILYGELLLTIGASDISHCSKFKVLGAYLVKIPVLFGLWFGINQLIEYTIFLMIQSSVC